MANELTIRASSAGDIDAVVALYPLAFPEEDLVPVVRDLLADPEVAMSLVATIDDEIVGNVIFTSCAVEDSNLNAALLAPLAVSPARQRQGIGTAIVQAGLQLLDANGVDVVLVLGDPAYYGRLGFTQSTDIQPPYPLPAEWYSAWQSQFLGGTDVTHAGKLVVPIQWLDPALWAP